MIVDVFEVVNVNQHKCTGDAVCDIIADQMLTPAAVVDAGQHIMIRLLRRGEAGFHEADTFMDHPLGQVQCRTDTGSQIHHVQGKMRTIFGEVIHKNKGGGKDKGQDQNLSPRITNQQGQDQNEEKEQVGRIFPWLTNRHEQAPGQEQTDPDVQCKGTAPDHFFFVADQQRDRYTEEQNIFQRMRTGWESHALHQTAQ